MSLKTLQARLDTPLYIVGGATRNMLLHVEAKDIDITAPMLAEDVIDRLRGSEFEVVPSSLRMGTLIIRDGDDKYEYTTFRTDSYLEGSGIHQPTSVKFTTDIELDARRRDFTINAIYYDVKQDIFIDPLEGIEDIKRRVIRTTRAPEDVFGEDGLRLLRLVRFYAELGFEIDGDTLDKATKLSHLLRDIKVERIQDELSKILIADVRGYGNTFGHYKGIKLLIDTGLMEYIIPELLEGKGVMQNPKYHDNDVLDHILDVFKLSDTSIRLAALMHDIGKPRNMAKVGNMYAHNEYGANMTYNILKRLKFPTKVIDETASLVRMHMFDIHGDAKVNTVKKFIVEHYDLIDKFLLLRFADLSSSLGTLDSYYKIKGILEKMRDEGIPMSVGDLPIDGTDLIAKGYKGAEIGKKLDEILLDVATGNVDKDRDSILKSIRGKYND